MRTWIVVLAAAVQLVCCNEVNSVVGSIPIVYEPTWMYKCEQSTTTSGSSSCIRSEVPQPVLTRSLTTFTSLDVCRTVCGRFGGLWPKPVTAALSMHTVKIHPNYLRFDLIDVPAAARELVAAMSRLVGQNLQAECDGNVTEVVETPVVVFISVKTEVLKLDWNTDEQYNLDVQSKGDGIQVKISAETVYGARHALESFTQLVAADRPDYSDQSFCSLRLVAGAKIRDSPAYKHRGFVLDTARHFIPMEDIKRTIDGMAASKMNVFHWHVTDSQSFPLESRRVPQFTRYGAYSPYQIYSTEEVRELVKYAQIRGVRVVIEIDSPAHAGNGWQWGKEYGFGELAVCVNVESWRNYCIQPPCGQLNPANPGVYRVLKDLYRDLAELLPEPALLHVGGDEVFFPCWNSVPEIIEYMTRKGYNTTSVEGFIQLWGEFHEKVLQLWDGEVVELGGTQQPVMIWSSELTQAHRIQKYLSKERYIVEVWEPSTSNLLQQLLQLGYSTVSIPKDLWYLDRGFWGTTLYSNWRKMYEYKLPKEEGMLGGEVAMWSEYVDEQGLDTRVWPRAAAVAERLWSNPSTRTDLAEPRLQRLRDRLVQRGLRPDVLSPGWCSQHEGKCK